jgi:hypothetical protein
VVARFDPDEASEEYSIMSVGGELRSEPPDREAVLIAIALAPGELVAPRRKLRYKDHCRGRAPERAPAFANDA